MRALLMSLALALLALPVSAHKSSDAYLALTVQGQTSTLRWDIALRDLDVALPTLDSNADRELTWGEVKAAWPRIDALALASLAVAGCRFEVTGHALEARNDGAYAVLLLRAPCRIDASTPLFYGLFREIDTTHRGLLRLSLDGAPATVRMLVPGGVPTLPAASPAASTASAELTTPEPTATNAVATSAVPTSAMPASAAPAALAEPHPVTSPSSFLREGIHHILSGYDHLLFLLCLLLPAVLLRQDGHWLPVRGWRQALLPVAKTVTLFTLAHSVTLALAALGWVRLSPRLTEPAIAATIMLAAFDNLRPLLLRYRGAVTFCFGLVHGFGFASVLAELQLPTAAFGWALFQFNLGLELGQLTLVFGVVPLLYLLRNKPWYPRGVLGAGSGMALVMATLWLLERTTDLRLMPF